MEALVIGAGPAGLMAARETVEWEKKALSWIQAAATALMIV